MILVGLLFSISAEARAEPEISVAESRQKLSPYGRWVDVPQYGRAWRPYRVGADWRPFTRGYWERLDSGAWLWHSDFRWGRIPFHYGRWFHDRYHGWVWIPGRVWAPSWVVWSNYRGHVAWAPLPPGPCWRGGRFVGVLPDRAWVFAREADFGPRYARFRPIYRRPWVTHLPYYRGYGPRYRGRRPRPHGYARPSPRYRPRYKEPYRKPAVRKPIRRRAKPVYKPRPAKKRARVRAYPPPTKQRESRSNSRKFKRRARTVKRQK